jgi:hypothetical protein
MKYSSQQLAAHVDVYGTMFVFRANGTFDMLRLDGYPSRTDLVVLIGYGYESHFVTYGGISCEMIFSKRNQLFEERNSRASKFLSSQAPEVQAQIDVECIYGNAVLIKRNTAQNKAEGQSALAAFVLPGASIRRGTRP